jgi:co-chaperonin GroES (HSP10)
VIDLSGPTGEMTEEELMTRCDQLLFSNDNLFKSLMIVSDSLSRTHDYIRQLEERIKKMEREKLKAYKDNVVVILDPREARKTEGGVYLPDSDNNSAFGEKILSGRVYDVGPGGYAEGVYYQTEVKKGDRVLFPCEAGDPVVVGEDVLPQSLPEFAPGTELRVMRHDVLLGIVS